MELARRTKQQTATIVTGESRALVVAEDRPCDVVAGPDVVFVDGPATLTFTADAAIETAHRLLDAGLAAKRRARNAVAGEPAPRPLAS